MKSKNNHIEAILTDPWYGLLASILSNILKSTAEFFSSEEISPYIFPVTTSSVSSPMGKGSDSIPVKIRLRKNDVYLADSMQFALEIGARLSGNGAYYIMPTFRGEKMGERHLNEFFHSEAEIAGIFEDIIPLVNRYIIYITRSLFEDEGIKIQKVVGDTSHIKALIDNPKEHFKQVEYETAVKLLKGVNGSLEDIGTNFKNITAIGEKYLIREYGEFIWLTHLPWENVPFYQAKEGGTPYAKAADLLAGIGEIAGCGQRVYSCIDLEESLNFHQVSRGDYQWYYDMRQVRPLQTSGFGLGIERYILWLTKRSDIRDCMLLIRDHDVVNTP